MAIFDGTSSADSLTGGAADDVLDGKAGNDTLTGAGGNDTMDGGADRDYVVLAGNKLDYQFSFEIRADVETNRVLLSVDTTPNRDGADTMINTEALRFADGQVQWYNVPINFTVDAAIGSGVNVRLVGGSMNDTLTGHDGFNNLIGGGGDDLIDGGAGIDFAEYIIVFDSYVTMTGYPVGGIQVNLQTGLVTGAWGNDTLVGIEGISGTMYDDEIVGNGEGNQLDGGAGNDTLVGGDGADGLTGGGGTDRVIGGTGDDTIYGAGGSTTAVFLGELEDYTLSLTALLEINLTDSTADRDATDKLVNVSFIEFSNATLAPADLINALGNTITGDASYESITGTIYNDLITGAGGNDTIKGNGGLDRAFYDGNISRYTIGESGEYRTVSDENFANGDDSLTGVDRLHFANMGIAFDLDGNAGAAARLIGVLFGGEMVYEPAYMRAVMGAFDYGYSAELIATVAIDYINPAFTPQQFAALVYFNLAHQQAGQADIDFIAGLIGEHSMAWLAIAAGNTVYNDNNIDFAGLVQNGVEFLPPG
jgi:hypothetical protein